MRKSAEYFFRELLHVTRMMHAAEHAYTPRELYAELYRVFCEALYELTADSRLDFSGTFARFTYVAQTLGLDEDLVSSINAFRSRARSASSNSASSHFAYDLKAVADLLARAFSQSLPAELLAALPARQPARPGKAPAGVRPCLRVSVVSWDAYYIYCVADTADSAQLRVCYNTDANFLGNWQYVGSLLSRGDQLNLVRPYERDGVCYPELIIYQPDYLVDISALAACFEPYGATPYNYLLRKLEARQSTRAMLLGNFASLMLDEALFGNHHASYNDCARKFFSQNALSLSVLPAADLEGFHDEARQQWQNIHQILHTAFSEDRLIDADKILLEPSFFCEMLGVQGRMDLLQADYRVLMEQKSGKKEYRTGSHQQKHYCQMLLYLALLHYAFGLRNDDISCFLLYSKYPDGLIKETPAPKLLFDILRLRNQVVWNEFALSRGGVRQLERLTVGRLNVNKLDDRFARQYLLPPIEEKLHVVQSATELEREYFFRMFTFVAREHLLSKIGTPQRPATGLSALWNSTLDEKLLSGNIFCSLTILRLIGPGESEDSEDSEYSEYSDYSDYSEYSDYSDNSAPPSSVESILLSVPEAEGDYLPNFRQGDIVILYRYPSGQEPDVRRGMVFRATIAEIHPDTILLQLRAPQRNPIVFRPQPGTLWAVEHDFMESSFASLYRSLFAFLQASRPRRELLLAQRTPTPADYTLLIGPPGTGKTSFGLMRRLHAELEAGPSRSVLLLSYTNRAIDEICSKLLKDGLPFLRIGNRHSCPEVYRPYLLEEQVARLGNAAQIRSMLLTARIVVGTTTSITSHLQLLELRPFSLAIVDEASQILEPHLLGILSAQCQGRDSIASFFLIGDHKQLPAVVQQEPEESAVSQPLLRAIGLTDCRNSLFERLLQVSPPQLVERFTRQGRMHRDVADFSSRRFYDGRLDVIPLPHQQRPLAFDRHADSGIELLLATHRMAFVDVPAPSHSPSAKVNQPEARLIAEAVMAVWRLYTQNGLPFDPTDTVGIIVPYRNQIAVVRREIDRLQRQAWSVPSSSSAVASLCDITIDTVERYQGSERNVIIYGFTVQQEYQLDFLAGNTFEENGNLIDRKLNVALTRAREQLLLVGNTRLLSLNPIFRNLIQYCRQPLR